MNRVILDKFVETTWNYKLKNYYLKFDIYEFTKFNDKFIVNIDHLHEGSGALVNYHCDYCGTVGSKPYHKLIRGRQFINKDCCNNKECTNQKTEEANFLRYGVKYTSTLDRVKQKVKQTNLERYGVDNPNQSEEVKLKKEKTNILKYGVKYIMQSDVAKEKRKQTCLDKYGNEYYAQTDEWKENYKSTCLERYGVENVFQVDEFKEKSKETMIERYGYEYNSQVPEIKEKSAINRNKTMYDNGIVPKSRQQVLIHEIIGGELNYPVDSLSLDIAFPDEMIYLEYQGSGHDLDVQIGKTTRNDFLNREIKRYYFLKNRGWRMIEIISKSKYDYLPDDNKIKEIVNDAKALLTKGDNFVSYDIDKGTMRNKEQTIPYEFGKLRKTIKSHIEEIILN